jgi:phosphohistidine phosphatase SixA
MTFYRALSLVLLVLISYACKNDIVEDEIIPKKEIAITSPEFVDELLLVNSNNFQIQTSEPATFSTTDPFIKLSSSGLIERLTSAEVVAIDLVANNDSTLKRRIYALGVKDDNYDAPNVSYNGPPGTDPYGSYLLGWKTLQKLPLTDGTTYAMILRHADADDGRDWNLDHPGEVGPANWWKSCDRTLARQLNAQGRERAKELGNIFRDLNYPITRVISSEFCRANETAKLINAGPTIVQDGRLNHLDYNVFFPKGIFPGMIEVMKEQPVNGTMTLIESHHPINELRDVTMEGFPSVIPFPWTGGYFVKISPDKTVTFEGAVSWGMFKYWRDKKLKRLQE